MKGQVAGNSGPLGAVPFSALRQSEEEEEAQTRVALLVRERRAALRYTRHAAATDQLALLTRRMAKTKKEAADANEAAVADGNEKSYHELIAHVNPIARPLASRKLSKKLYKCVKKGTKRARCRRNRSIRVIWFQLLLFSMIRHVARGGNVLQGRGHGRSLVAARARLFHRSVIKYHQTALYNHTFYGSRPVKRSVM